MYSAENFVLAAGFSLSGTNQVSACGVNDAGGEQIAGADLLCPPGNQQAYVRSSPTDLERESTVYMNVGRAAHQLQNVLNALR
jgi:hypothetical protein